MQTTDTQRPLFEISDLSCSFGGLKAVSNFHLSANQGDILGIIGPNGAGKTTVFNLVTGVYRPDQGKISLHGDNVAGQPSHIIVAKGISRTFQNIRLFKSMTVLENMLTAGYCQAGYTLANALFRTTRYRNREQAMRDQALGILEAFGLVKRQNELAASLPYGLQRKVELARALVSRPSVLLLDEPGAGMNPSELDGLIELIQWVRSTYSTTIILIEHRMRLVMKLCQRVTVLHFGEIIFEGKPDELSGNEIVVKAYFGDANETFGN
jgi:branched-chain amino acid transport system ATP-binding protein